MKQILCLLVLLFTGCGSMRMVGNLNMLSTRNVDSGASYQLLKTGTDDSRGAVKKSKAKNIDQAVNNVVMDIPGGEFLKNVKIYYDGNSWAVIGDVWGLPDNANIEGFRVGDVVYIKNNLLNSAVSGTKFTRAEITGFKDKTTCLVKFPGGEIKEANYKDLSKTGE